MQNNKCSRKYGVKAPIDAVDKETALGSVITGETKNVKGFLQKVKETNERHAKELERSRESDNIYELHHGIDDPLCNWIPQGMRDRRCTDAYFVSNVLLLPAL